MSPRTGRPKSEKSKDLTLKFRMDEITNSKLIKIAEIKNTTKAEVIRKGIEIQYENLDEN